MSSWYSSACWSCASCSGSSRQPTVLAQPVSWASWWTRRLPAYFVPSSFSIALIAARRTFFEAMVVADYDASRAVQVAESTSDPRFVAAQVDASDTAAVVRLLADHRCDVLVNATDPRFVMPLFRAALALWVAEADGRVVGSAIRA